MKIIKWLRESNRWKHLIGGFLVGLLSVWLCVGIAFGMEFKDWLYAGANGGKLGFIFSEARFGWFYKNCNSFDWIDFWLTVIGGVLGCLIRFIF